jgi:hypothetical protein
MKFDTMDVCQSALFKCYGIKRGNLYNDKNMFINDDLKVMNDNSDLQKSRLNTTAIVASVNKIVE